MAEVAPTENVTAEQQHQQNATEQVNGKDGNGEKSCKAETENEPPKNLKEDPVGWINQQSKAAMHKVNYKVLEWVKNTITEEDKKEIVGREPGYVTRSQFLDYLRDGTILAQLINVLQPDPQFDAEASKDVNNQKTNLEAFLQFCKDKAGIEQDQLFELKDLQEKGKGGYQAVLNTIFHLALISEQKFNKTAIDIEAIIAEVPEASESNFFSNLLNVVKRANPPSIAGLRRSISASFSALIATFSRTEEPKNETGNDAQPGIDAGTSTITDQVTDDANKGKEQKTDATEKQAETAPMEQKVES